MSVPKPAVSENFIVPDAHVSEIVVLATTFAVFPAASLVVSVTWADAVPVGLVGAAAAVACAVALLVALWCSCPTESPAVRAAVIVGVPAVVSLKKKVAVLVPALIVTVVIGVPKLPAVAAN